MLKEIAALLDALLPTVKSRWQWARMALMTLLHEAVVVHHTLDGDCSPPLAESAEAFENGAPLLIYEGVQQQGRLADF